MTYFTRSITSLVVLMKIGTILVYLYREWSGFQSTLCTQLRSYYLAREVSV